MVRVSVPSVRLSAAIGIDTVALPIELTVAKPVNALPVMSEDETPDNEYEMLEPAETLDVVITKSAVEPSLTEELLVETA